MRVGAVASATEGTQEGDAKKRRLPRRSRGSVLPCVASVSVLVALLLCENRAAYFSCRSTGTSRADTRSGPTICASTLRSRTRGTGGFIQTPGSVKESGGQFFVTLLPTQPYYSRVRALFDDAGVGVIDLNACYARRDEGHRSGRCFRHAIAHSYRSQQYAPRRRSTWPTAVRLQSLRIADFTAFEDADLSFSPGLNVFVGENGTGKTHLLKLPYAVLRACAQDGSKVQLLPTKDRLRRQIGRKARWRAAPGSTRQTGAQRGQRKSAQVVRSANAGGASPCTWSKSNGLPG